MTTRALRSDALPEGWILRGLRAACGHLTPCGCHHWRECCTACPYPDCIRFTGQQGRHTANIPRNAAIATARRSGAAVDDICDRFHLSKRRVFRILAAARGSRRYFIKPAPSKKAH